MYTNRVGAPTLSLVYRMYTDRVEAPALSLNNRQRMVYTLLHAQLYGILNGREGHPFLPLSFIK